MIFHSFQYLLFLPLVVAAHFTLPHKFRWALLLAASYYFYAAWRVDFLIILIASTVTDYFSGLLMEREKNTRVRNLILGCSLTVNLGLLFFFKYASVVWDAICRLSTGLLNADPTVFRHFDITLPLGISFYTFQTLSYTIDIYRRRIPAERHLGYFALYVAFFPQLLAGPIERAGHLLKELRKPRDFDWSCVGPAYFLIVLGLAKKLVISDRLGGVLAPIVESPLEYQPLVVLLTAPATVYQYYCDLSGYADMALGSAMLLGIKLSPNFDRPFAASSTMRFWYRWHITVTAWFRDYLLRPLAKHGSVASSRPAALILTGMVIGLWHGPTLGWAIAGCTVGLLAIPESKWARWRIRNNVGPRTPAQRFLWDWAGRLYVWTIVFFLIGMPLTWSSVDMLWAVLTHIATFGADAPLIHPMIYTSRYNLEIVIIAIALLELWQWLEARGLAKNIINAMCLEVRWVMASSFAAGVLGLANLSQSGFLYFKF
ncbi:MBOAT family O-acyltransferase [Radicibacter daui]|uniref:MBOAT family O-acyltransferase n=1 Tax=Radicibacter daui TaxID=3064829 RepID=UPI004046D0A3